MNVSWKTLPFEDVVCDETGGNIKTLQSDFLQEGQYAIVDQGKELIAGYSDDPGRLCRSDLPVIIFGDHTKCFKFIDFPFCLGADGTKVLRPRNGEDPKYLYHFLRHVRLTDAGYSRHFKFLKELKIPLPPLPEQRRIAAILDAADSLRAKRRAALAKLDQLAQSIFIEMFGDPSHNPRGWIQKPLGQCFAEPPIFGSMIPPTSEEKPWLSLRVANIQDWQLDLNDKKYIELDAEGLRRHTLRKGDIILARAIASQDHLGKCVVVDPGENQWAFDSHLMRLRMDPTQIRPEFLTTMFRTPGGRHVFLRATRKSTVQYNINTKEMAALAVPVPPLDRQNHFVGLCQQLSGLKRIAEAAESKLTAVFASLQHRAFRGDL